MAEEVVERVLGTGAQHVSKIKAYEHLADAPQETAAVEVEKAVVVEKPVVVAPSEPTLQA